MKRVVSNTRVYSCAVVLLAGLAGVASSVYGEVSTALPAAKDTAGRLGCRVEFFDVNGRPAFVYLPTKDAGLSAIPWVWYAPTLPANPDPSLVWMFRRFLDRGIAIAGVDVGESYGNPQGRVIYTALWEKLRRDYKLTERACLMPQSRGGLMLYNWAAENPARVACIAGIYTVCDPRSYPGLATACGAYGMDEATLTARLAEHNPLDRLRPLAEAGVPILHVHGDNDKVVPLEKNSGELARRYLALGGSMRLIVVPGKGHEVMPEFFESQELLDFVITHATTEAKSATTRPVIRKLGTIDCDLVESTPIVFKGRLYRVEYVRELYKHKADGESSSYFRLVDVATGTPTPPFARGHHLCSAIVEGDTVYVFGVDKWGAGSVDGYASTDLKNWRSFKALDLPGWGIFNNSVCKGDGRYVMAIEIDAPPEETGVRFTIRFAESKDLEHWTLTPSACVYAKDRYTSCPTIRFHDGRYYLMYCEELPGPTYLTYLLRGTDLVHWDTSPLNPVMRLSSEDHQVSPHAKGLTPEERQRVAQGVNVCNTDIDLCEFEGKVVLYYCWGNQTGVEFLAEARYDGTLTEFLTGFFPAATTKPGASTIPLIRNGQSDYRIVTPVQASPAVSYAAGELQSFLEQISGVRLPIVSEKDAGDAPSILLGPCEKSQKAGLPAAAAQLGEDGVLIRTLGRDLALLGRNERGNLYSVYVLLEKYFGVRFLAWDCTVVPRQSEVALPELDYSYAPPFMYRETLYFNSFPKEIATRQRLNGPTTKCDESVGGKIDFYPYVHSFDDLFPEKEYFEDHPEYYGLNGGKRVAGSVHAQLCLTNPDVLRLAKEKVLKWIDEHPNVPIIDVSQNDGNGACECEKCAAIVKEEGSQQGTILRFVNAIADEVAKKHPDKWVETLAYAYSMTPPAITRPRSNVIIRLCHAGCFLHGFEQCKQGAELAAYVDQWSKLTRRIFVWHYGTNFAHYFAPNPNLNGLVKDIRFYAAHGVNGLMVQCNYQGPGGELAELRQYLCAQLLWNPAQDPMQIREEFCRGYYGKAAPDVLEFLRRMDRASEEPVHIFAVWDPQVTVTPACMDDAMKILQKALSSADTPAEKNRVEKLMLPFWYVKFMYPDKYGLSNADAVALLARVKRVITANAITHVAEGEPNIQPWLVSLEARYPTSRPKR